MTTLQKKYRSWLIILLLITLIFVVRAAWLSVTHATPASNNPVEGDSALITVSTISTQLSMQAKVLEFAGLVVAREQVPVYADLAQGRVVQILAEVGQMVKAGQPLALIDSTLLNIQKNQQQASQQHAAEVVKQQEAMLEEAKAQFDQANSEKTRADAIADTGLLSLEAIEQRDTAAKVALAHVKTAQNNLNIALSDASLAQGQIAENNLRLHQATITAPVAGQIISRTAQIGLLLGQNGDPLFSMIKDHELEVEFEASSNELAELKIGMALKINSLSNSSINTGIVGKIRLLAPAVNSQSQYGKVRVSLNKEQSATQGLVLNQPVHISLHLTPKKAIYLPESALLIEGNTNMVFTVKSSAKNAGLVIGKVKRLTVTIGERSNGLVEITSGIAIGEHVVDRYTAYLRDGETVRMAAR